ncbi:MAG: sulfotransferase domain-containing protein [Candidatus Binatia bacterium]
MVSVRYLRHRLSKTRVRAPFIWLRHRGLRPDDVLIASYPRSGNTWLRFLLAEILTTQSSEFQTIDQVIPEVGNHHRAVRILPRGGRLIKSHEPYRKEYQRAVYLVRDPRDVMLSEYTYYRSLQLYGKEMDAFLLQFLKGKANGYGTWVNHVDSWLKVARGNDRHFFVVKYEELRRKTEDILDGILDFLHVQVSRSTMREAIRNNSIDRMRAKEQNALDTVFRSIRENGRFVDKGIVGDWVGKLSSQQEQLIESCAGEVLTRLGYPTGNAK